MVYESPKARGRHSNISTYPVLWSSSSVKVKVKSQGILLGKRSSIDFYSVYHDRYFHGQLYEHSFTKKKLLHKSQARF